MQLSDGRVDGTVLELFVLEGDTHEFTIETEAQLALVHVKEDTKSALLFEAFSILRADGSVAVAELACRVVGPAARVIAEGRLQINVAVFDDSGLQFIFSPAVGDKLPVMGTLDEADVADRRAEQIIVFIEEGMAASRSQLDAIRCVLRIECKIRDGCLLSRANKLKVQGGCLDFVLLTVNV